MFAPRRSPAAAWRTPAQQLVGLVLGKKRAPRPTRRSIDGGNAPAVLRIGRIIRMRDLRALLAVADRRDPGPGDAGRSKHVFHGLSPAFAERQVVFARAALVAMTLDGDADIAEAPQPIGLALQDLLALGGNLGAVIGEEHAVAGGRGQILLRSRPEPRAADPTRPTRPARTTRRFRRAAASGKHQQSPGDGNEA